MIWNLSHRADTAALPIADRHYNRQKPGTLQFVPPGRCLVLLSEGALWVSSWPFAEYVRHQWAGAWVNSCFRRESGPLASEMIRSALAATRWFWGDPPALGMVTFINRGKVRHKRDFGRCYRRAGFRECGETKGGLLALQLLPADMPEPEPPIGSQSGLFDAPVVDGDHARSRKIAPVLGSDNSSLSSARTTIDALNATGVENPLPKGPAKP